ncbi:MAG: hypothetical protein ABSA71_02045 [Desulfomonilia bacterium]|jgi:hypothetical protein
MYRKKNRDEVSKTKEFTAIDPLYDLIEIMGDHLVRVYEHREKSREQIGSYKQPCQDRLIVEAIAEFLMTGKFQLRCPINEWENVSVGRFER